MRATFGRQLPDTGTGSLDKSIAEDALQAIAAARAKPAKRIIAFGADKLGKPARTHRDLDESLFDVRDRCFALRPFGQRGQDVECDAHARPLKPEPVRLARFQQCYADRSGRSIDVVGASQQAKVQFCTNGDLGAADRAIKVNNRLRLLFYGRFRRSSPSLPTQQATASLRRNKQK
jgi:hypothetical protein